MVERLNAKSGEWKILPGIKYHGRNYALFATLAGVRNSEGLEPWFEPRGLPTNCSAETYNAKFAEFSPLDDYRTTSYITLEELGNRNGDNPEESFWVRFGKEYNETEFSDGVMKALYRAYNSNDNDPRGEVRIVFWFDDTSNE